MKIYTFGQLFALCLISACTSAFGQEKPVPGKTNIVLSIFRDGQNAQLIVTGIPAGASVSIERSSSPAGPWTKLDSGPTPSAVAPEGTVRVTVQTTQPGMFFRAKVEPSLGGMALIPAGEFTMGFGYNPFSVQVSAFQIDRSEVTKALWDEVYSWAVTNGYEFDNAGSAKAINHPVNMVNWSDAAKWCNARSEKEGLSPAYYTDRGHKVVWRTGQDCVDNPRVNWIAGYRLPTDAEWQKAAQGGAGWHLFPWGDTISHDQANYDSTGGTRPVGSFQPNSYGLYDMVGNVAEWCWDLAICNDNYDPADEPNDPRGPSAGVERTIHGGSWGDDVRYCRMDYLYSAPYGTYYRNGNTGFRTVLSVNE